MKYNDILKIHNSTKSETSHSDILGDAFLLSQNPTYLRIKTHAQKIGVTFSEATAKYLLLPFNQLDKIVASKSVPYVPHARLMIETETAHPEVFDLEQMPMPESYHLHEAAHVIAEDCCNQIKVVTSQDQILKAILCESFANMVDAMSCGYAESETHRLFLKLNCYMLPTSETFELMNSVRKHFGEAYTARLVLISYLHANFLREEVPVELLGDGKNNEDAIALSSIGQELDMLFRLHTTQNYFHLKGFKGEVMDLLHFDFTKLLSRNDFASAVDALIAVVA